MVVYENIENGLVRAYSDKGVKIHGGFPEDDYVEAVDPKNKNRKYVETDIKIVVEKPEATIEDYQAKLEELGVTL